MAGAIAEASLATLRQRQTQHLRDIAAARFLRKCNKCGLGHIGVRRNFDEDVSARWRQWSDHVAYNMIVTKSRTLVFAGAYFARQTIFRQHNKAAICACVPAVGHCAVEMKL